ncbi:MAG: hypothetical protein JRE57_02800 [Deltaproteobacteria bacterium]|nr:hypothetical protein [Deltaproteobacteria bacterium]
MDKTAEFASGHVSRSTASAPGADQRSSDRRRRGSHGEELRAELKVARLQRRTLAITTAVMFLACGSLAVWASLQQSTLRASVNRKQEQIVGLTKQLAVATTALEESRLAVDSLIMGRIPGLSPFRVKEPISVDTPFVRELSFKPLSPPAFGHECKLVVENDSSSAIRPALSVVLFNDVGIELARAQLMDGIRDELRVDEIRSFFASLEIAEGSVPSYFLLTSD